MVRLSEIWMRDPFLLSTRDAVDLSAGAEAGVGLPRAAARPLFWLYGTTDAPPAGVGPYSEFPATGFECYSSDDLVEWRGPVQCFRRPEGFWADTQFWAPEVHLFEGRLVMLATMKRKGKAAHRGVAVLESPSGHPEGPFVPLTRGPVTPNDWSCLDGTLMVENGV